MDHAGSPLSSYRKSEQCSASGPGRILRLASATIAAIRAAFFSFVRVGDTGTRRTAGRPRRVRMTSRSEEHTSELQSLMRISYAVFCLKKKKKTDQQK